MARTYQVSVEDVVLDVRRLTQDTNAPFRTSDNEILAWLNDAVAAMVSLLPHLFVQQSEYTAVAGSRQTLDLNRAHSVIGVVGVPYADYYAMSAYDPTWQSGSTATIKSWLRLENEPLTFYTYPPQQAGAKLQVLFVQSPSSMSLTDKVPLSEVYKPALVAYCVAMVESKDDEHVDSQRAAQAMTDFVGRIKGGA